MLDERKLKVLYAIINSYILSAEPIGSRTISKNYDLGVSSATIRNEMSRLMDLGLLEKSHMSSGRFATDQALRDYVSGILNSTSLNPLITIDIRQGIFRERFSKEEVINTILTLLSQKTNSIAFVVIDGICRYWGVSNLFKYEELKDIPTIQRILNVIEDVDFLNNMMEKYSGSGVSLLIGEESGIKDLDGCTLMFTKLPFWNTTDAYVGVLGSKRMDYCNAVPAIREVQNAMRNSMKGWN